MSLIRGIDCAFPRPSYPSWAVVVCGYVGGDTPHIWSLAEVQTVRAAGQIWWAIWTSRNGSTTKLTMDDGRADAAGMTANLPKYGYSKSSPVFYDVEPRVFDNDPTGARLAIAKWKLDMKAAGYLQAYSYTVERQGGDWVADPTGMMPSSLPPGRIGVQYGQSPEQPNPFFDYNVFDSSLLPGSDDMTPDESAKLNAIDAALTYGGKVYPVAYAFKTIVEPMATTVAGLKAQLAALIDAVAQLQGGSQVVDYARVQAAAAAALQGAHIVTGP